MARSQPAIEFISASYKIGTTAVLSRLDLAIQAGETMVLLGRSGAGKTTALKLINALLLPTEGEVRVQGEATASWDLIRLRRSIGYAIQDVGLFPHLDVARNIGILPRLDRWPPKKTAARVNELMDLIGLAPLQFRYRYPHQLSGGQRQRVGLARALAVNPPILLMDEPFGALDPLTRAEMQQEFTRLQRRLKKTVVFVTHDVHEALLLADRIALMNDGQMVGLYSPGEFLQSRDPLASAYVRTLQQADRHFDNCEQPE